MNGTARFLALVLFLSLPAICSAQNMGQVQCAQSGDYIYLYSSITTLEVRARLACGQQVQITGRYDLYVSVRTERGEVGFVSLDNIQFLRAKPVAKSPRSLPAEPCADGTTPGRSKLS